MTTELDLIDQLTATGGYKVIRHLKPVDHYHDDPGAQDFSCKKIPTLVRKSLHDYQKRLTDAVQWAG